MKWSLFLISFFVIEQAAAQPFQTKMYTTKEGLSSNAVVCTEPDNRGFLWVATANGLNRFDGHVFDQFYNNPDDSSSLPANETQTLFTDNKQQLWVGGVGGISKYNPRVQNFTNYFPDSSAGKCGRYFIAMAQDKNDQIWLGSWYELLIFNEPQKKFTRSGWANYALTHKPANGNNSRIVILSLVKKSADELWILSTYGLYSVNTTTKQFTYYPNNILDDYYGCQATYMDKQGRLWIGTYNKGLLSYDSNKNRWQQFSLPGNSIAGNNSYTAAGIMPINNDTLMFCSTKALYFLNKMAGKTIDKFEYQAGNPQSFPAVTGISITSFKNNYWIASSNGLIKMHPPKTSIKKTIPFGNTDWIDFMFPLADDKYMICNGAKEMIGVVDDNHTEIDYVKNRNGTPLKAFLSGYFDAGNQNAFISGDEKLYNLNMNILVADSIALPPKRFSQNKWIWRNIVKDKAGRLYVRSRQQGILRYDPGTAQWLYLDVAEPSFDKTYTALYYDAVSNSLWVSIENEGVYVYNISSQKTVHYPLQLNNKGNKASINVIRGFGDGYVYLADVHKGLYQFDIRQNTFRLFTVQDGLPSNNCFYIVADTAKNIWVSTSEGICFFNRQLNSFTPFNNGHLFPDGPSYLMASGGFICCIDNNAVFSWPSALQQQTQNTVAVYLRAALANGSLLPVSNSYQLSAGQNNIGFQFGALNFGAEMQPSLVYQINHSNNWVRLPPDGKLTFINLAPGTYSISVKEPGTSVQLDLMLFIQSPVWQRWWFIGGVAALLLLIVFYFVLRRITNIRKQSMLQQRMAETEMMALRAQMNPHFIFNCISSIDNFILGNDKESASSYLNKFAKLIRNSLDSSNNSLVPFWKDWETIQLYLELEQMRSNGKFEYQLNASETLLKGHYKIPPLIVQPYIENAIHHGLMQRPGDGGKLLVIADLRGEELCYTIQDNGIGRQKAAELVQARKFQHFSYGMQLSAERIAVFNSNGKNNVKIDDLKNEDGQATGTLVEVRLQV